MMHPDGTLLPVENCVCPHCSLARRVGGDKWVMDSRVTVRPGRPVPVHGLTPPVKVRMPGPSKRQVAKAVEALPTFKDDLRSWYRDLFELWIHDNNVGTWPDRITAWALVGLIASPVALTIPVQVLWYRRSRRKRVVQRMEKAAWN